MDEGKIAFSVGVELSYLPPEIQYDLLEIIDREDCTPSYSQAFRLHKSFNNCSLSREGLAAVMSEEKPNQRDRIVLPRKAFDEVTAKKTLKSSLLRQFAFTIITVNASVKRSDDYDKKSVCICSCCFHTFVESPPCMYDKYSGYSHYREAQSMRKAKPIRIASVRYNYIGTDDDFNRFLRNVVMDYLQEDVISPLEDDPTTQKEDRNDQQIA